MMMMIYIYIRRQVDKFTEFQLEISQDIDKYTKYYTAVFRNLIQIALYNIIKFLIKLTGPKPNKIFIIVKVIRIILFLIFPKLCWN